MTMKLFGKEVYLLGKPVTKKRIFNIFWLLDAWQSRGSGLIAQLRITNLGMLSQFGVILLLFKLSSKWLVIIIILFYLFTTWLGKLDADKIGYWAFSNNKDRVYKTNPYERRIEQRLMRIESKLGTLQEANIYDEEE